MNLGIQSHEVSAASKIRAKRRSSREAIDDVEFDVTMGPAAVEIQEARGEVQLELTRGEESGEKAGHSPRRIHEEE